MEKKKSNNLPVCIVCGILTVFGILLSIISLGHVRGEIRMALDVLNIALSVLIFYYAIVGYRRPHGNLLKYIIFIFALNRLISVYKNALIEDALRAVNNAIQGGLLCYMAGRLHRVKQNLVIMGIVVVLMVISIITGFMNGVTTVGVFTTLIIWFDICVAYVLRYKEHKEAGILDAPEK